MRKILFLFFLLLFSITIFFSLSSQVLAREWEVGWPDLPGMTSPTNLPPGEKVTLNYVVTYVFMFALMTVGFVAFLMLIINALRYMTSTAMPGGKAAAIEQIRNIGFGVLLMLGAYILLNSINPELTIFGLEEVEERMASIPFYQTTLYKDTNCAGEYQVFFEEPDLTQVTWKDGTQLNDNVGSFKLSSNLVARICHHTNYDDVVPPPGGQRGCNINIGDAAGTCINSTYAADGPQGQAWDFGNPGDPQGISSIKAEGWLGDTHLILFEKQYFSGDSRTFKHDSSLNYECQKNAAYGASYWIAEGYNAILCKDNDWNYCTGTENAVGSWLGRATGNPNPPPTVNPGESYPTFCLYGPPPTDRCVGKLVNDGNSRDFIPGNTPCKNLGATYDHANVNEAAAIGANCNTAIHVYANDNCDSEIGGPPWAGPNSGGTIDAP